jgi:phosphate transport system substrate-binding protein
MKFGYCTNLPDVCDNAKKKELLPFSAQDSVCPKCGSRLMPVGVKSSSEPVRKDLIKIAIGVAVLAILFFGGWKLVDWRKVGDDSAVTSGVDTGAAAASDSASPAAGKDEDGNTVILRLAGSNTIGEKLAPRLAMAWLESIGGREITLKHRCRNGRLILSGRDNQKTLARRCGDSEYNPESVVQAVMNEGRVSVDIRAHGSSSAFEALALASAEISTDIGMSSRKIKPEEVLSLAGLGNMESLRSEHVIGLDGIAVIAHRNRSLDAISIQDLRRIFTGEIEYWPGSGAPGQRIEVHARDDISGTYDTFKSIVLSRGDKLISSARRYEDSAALAAAVAADENAIGFVGLAYVTAGVRAIPVSASAAAAALSPTEFTIKKEDYALARRLYFYTAERPRNRYAMEFVDFVSSSRGQKIVDESGFVDLTPSTREPSGVGSWERPSCVLSDQWPGSRDDYCDLIEGKREMSVSFRFLSDSDELDNRARKDLLRILEDLESQGDDNFKVALIGFADSDGSYESNIDLSKRRSQRVVRALESLGITDITVHAFGEEVPVGDNGSDVGKEKNRRVEVWLY